MHRQFEPKLSVSAALGMAIGEQTTELAHVGLIAMLCGATAALFDQACFNLPTLGQLYKIAALDAIRPA